MPTQLSKFKFVIMLVVLAAALAGCNLPSRTPAPEDQPGFIYTAAAQTFQAQVTQPAGTPIAFPTATPGGVGQPSVTPLPVVVVPTNTPGAIIIATQPSGSQPTATSAALCDKATFVADVTYPDDSQVPTGTSFVKTWRLRNDGTCTWNSSYAIIFDSGDALSGPAAGQMTTGPVAPGQTVDVSVTLRAPDTARTYQGYWRLRNSNGAVFGIGSTGQSAIWVKIKAVSPFTATPSYTATPVANVMYDFVVKGPNAEWRNGSVPLAWGDPEDDSPGLAVNLNNVKIEDGKTYNDVLATYVQRVENGMIAGLYPVYTVQNGDKLRALLGFRRQACNGKVKFQIKVRDATGVETLLGEWLKQCDGKLLAIEKDLSSLAGKNVQFVFIVTAEGSHDDDLAVWVGPKVVR